MRTQAWCRGLALVVALSLFGACGDGIDDPTQGDGRDAAVYEAVLHWVAAMTPLPDPAPEDPLRLFVMSRSEETIDVDVQIALVDALLPVEVVFVDSRSEALLEDEPDEPVRDGANLVGLGAVGAEGTSIEVYFDSYGSADDYRAWIVTVERSGDGWRMAEAPEPTDPRPLPRDS